MKSKLLIANRGEIALRIAVAARELGIPTVAVYSIDDAQAPHRLEAQESVSLEKTGASAYLDIPAIVAAAKATDCTLVHPGYGFLSESAQFASACKEAGLTFIGPGADVLTLFGDKGRARSFAENLEVPVAHGTQGNTTLEEMRSFIASLPPGSKAMIKAVNGGGGRGMRIVRSPAELEAAYERCSSEARKAFGNGMLYIEQYVNNARHIEVQVAGDGKQVAHIGERDCSVQVRNQKLIEIAPAPDLAPQDRQALLDVSTRMASACSLSGLCTFEFLVSSDLPERYIFMEANPRLQVEHTVTEEVFDIDLVRAQIALALGASLHDVGLAAGQLKAPRGYAIQYRVSMDGKDVSATGRVSNLNIPTGQGVRVETFLREGVTPSRLFDPLLAKLVVRSHGDQFSVAAEKGSQAVRSFRIGGVDTNLAFLEAISTDAEFQAGSVTTGFIERREADLVKAAEPHRSRRLAEAASLPAASSTEPRADLAASTHDPDDVLAPMMGTVVEIGVAVGDQIRKHDVLCVLDAMKMEHTIEAPHDGVLRCAHISPGDVVNAGQTLFLIEAGAAGTPTKERALQEAEPEPRRDLEEVLQTRGMRYDESRPEAVAKRHAKGRRTARENILDLCDEDSFLEYGGSAVAAHHGVRPLEELRRTSPADGFISGIGTINGAQFGRENTRCFIGSYDYTVHAGTQGFFGHKKHDRLFQLAEAARLPVILFTEGGGGRPTEPNNVGGANLASATFFSFARLSGSVPLIGIVSGRCFAGNAALLGCCDVVIATRDATIGMGGPVMIEGAGLGVYKPEEVGPADMHARHGVVDILVDDEAQAVAVTKQYLGYFQGAIEQWTAPDQTALREAIPARRTRVYDIRQVIATLADEDSVLELRSGFAVGAVTVLARLQGRPIGIIANNPAHNAGAVCAAEADKFTRFIKLCDAHGIPLVSLCDTPGIMVGPEAEKTAIVRHSSRMMIAGAHIRVPYFTIVLRKAYGLGAMAMGGGSFHHASFFSIAWPTAEFGGMGLEGQVRLGHRHTLEKIQDPIEREEKFKALVNDLYQHGKAENYAPFLVIDEVIDPAETREWILAGLDTNAKRLTSPSHPRSQGVDPW